MQNRSSSSEAHWFGYSLFVESLPESMNADATGWRARVLKPDGVPFSNPRLDGPFKTQRLGEEYAEALVRQYLHGEGDGPDADDYPNWERH